MGVRGLTSYIARDSNTYLQATLLSDCNLIIDGNCIASHLYRWVTKRDSAFGGDYDEYALIVKNFFNNLKRFNITPFVFLDGGYETKKMKTVIKRFKSKLMTLKTSFCRGFAADKFFPLFMRHVFYDIAVSLNVHVIQCEFEADGEVAALARHLNCPVLSYDSDFYIYDVLYIPFSTFELNSSNETSGVKCSLYDVTRFLKQYPGLTKTHLPLLATLLGNDFVENYIFKKFFDSIPLSRKKNLSCTEQKIHAVLNWLKNENEKSAVEKIKISIGKVNYEKFATALEMCKQLYSEPCHCDVQEVQGTIVVKAPPFSLPLSPYVIDLLSTGKLPSTVIPLVSHRLIFFPLQVEEVDKDSSYLHAIPIILSVDRLLTANDSNRDVKIHIRQKRTFVFETWPNPLRTDENLDTLLSSSLKERQKYIYDVLNMNEKDRICVQTFPDDSQIFFLCFVYWANSFHPSVSQVHSLLLSYLGCQAKIKTGLFRVNVCPAECSADFTRLLSSYRKTSESSRKSYCISHVHAFNNFQAIVFAVSILNILLGSPFISCKFHESLSGTLNHNLCITLTGKQDVVSAIRTFLESVPGIWTLYEELCTRIVSYFSDAPKDVASEGGRKKRKKKKNSDTRIRTLQTIQDADVSELHSETENERDFEDICNKFSILSSHR